MTGDPDIELGAFGPRSDDHGAHFCDHAPATFADQGCPRWPACLGPGSSPGIGLLRTARPVTDDEAVAFAARWREAMAQGRPAAVYLGPSKATRRARVAAWLREWTR